MNDTPERTLRVGQTTFGHPELEPNRLICGENLDVMRSLPSESIDTVYIDPPYFSGRNYNVTSTQSERRSFTDVWEGGMPDYLSWLSERLIEVKRLLKDTGSVFVHLDWHAVHYVKVEMDRIFGYGGDSRLPGFRSEIIWPAGAGARSRNQFSIKHYTILHYSKGSNWYFNSNDPGVRKPYKQITIDMHFKNVDQDGRRYRIQSKNGRDYITYENQGMVCDCIWDDINAQDATSPIMGERIGYPTQKPEKLLRRIIAATVPYGGVIADFFVGGGTTPAAAAKMGRRWIACDQSHASIAVTAERIAKIAEMPGSHAMPDLIVEHRQA